MKKLFFFLMLAATQFANAQQLSNTTFDGTWENCYPWEKGAKITTAKGTQPEGWCVSNVPNVKMFVTVQTPILGAEENGADGTGKSIKLTNGNASGQNIPAYMTLGTTWATAETQMNNVRNADGGVFGGIAFTYHPDAVRLTYKHDISQGAENMSVIAYLWKGTWTQADVPSNTAVGIWDYGTAKKVPMTNRINNILGKDCLQGGAISKTDDAALIASVEYYNNTSVSTWTTMELPLEYKSSATPEKLNIVIAANGLFDDRSTIKQNNSVSIDDVELVYWHALSALSYEGATLNFSENTTNYDLSTVLYDETKLSYTVKGRAATATKNYNEETHILTIRVEGEDIASNSSSFTEYTIQFAEPVPQVVSSKVYSEDLYVTIGEETADKQVANVVVETLDNGNINFMLKNFVLGEGDSALPVGNIAVNNIKVAADGSFIFNGGVAIAAGDDPAYEGEWIGPDITTACGSSVPLDLKGQFLTEDHIVVYINIDIAEFLGYAVEVHLGYDAAPMAVNATAQYGTFCAPFDVEVPAGITAYTVPSIDGNLLNLQEVGGTIPANTPVVLYAESGLEKVMFFGLAKEGNPVADVLTGVYENTPAPVGSYVLQNLN
ncbi:MAG: calycin-like domain-containing protein, partial [Bacteroidaceae bacterium]|nr:calycin-like domain-containing protein [Bacteroidaceae bacterium]